MNYIKNSIPIIVKRTLFRRMKIIKIQQHYKLRILRKKLAAIVIPDDEDDHAEDLLDFFNDENKEKEEEKINDLELDKKLEEIGKKIEKNIKNKNLKKNKSKNNNFSLEVIKEEEKEREKDFDNQQGLQGIDIDKIPDLDISDDDIKDIKEIKNDIEKNELINEKNKNVSKNNVEINKEKDIKINEHTRNSSKNNILNNIMNITNKFVPSDIENNKAKEKDSLIVKLLENPKYSTKINSRLNPIRLAPISNTQKIQTNHPDSNKNINNNNHQIIKNNVANNNNSNNNYNEQNINMLKKGLGLTPDSIKNSGYPYKKHGHKIIIKDEEYYGNYVDINAQTNLPKVEENEKEKKRPVSKGVFLPNIKNNLNASTTTISNDTHSVISHATTGKQMLKINHKVYKPKNKEILLLEQKCREAIERAKAEWNFTDKKLELIIVNKIRKKYSDQIKKILKRGING